MSEVVGPLAEPLAPPVDGLATGVLGDVALPLALAVVTLGMGLSLAREDFARVARNPRAVLGGLAAQVLLLPTLAVGVALAGYHLLGLSPALALGVLVLACCPGGATSNLVAYLARADAALSVTLTGVASLASVLTAPLLLYATTRLVFAEGARVAVSLADTATLVLVVIALPVLAGMEIRRRDPDFARRAQKPVRLASALVLALVILAVVAQNGDRFLDLARRAVPAAILLNALALGGGLLVGRLLRLPVRQARAIGIEVGFQNGTLGIALAISQLRSAEAAVLPGFYSLVMFATGGALAWVWSREAAAARRDPEAERDAA